MQFKCKSDKKSGLSSFNRADTIIIIIIKIISTELFRHHSRYLVSSMKLIGKIKKKQHVFVSSHVNCQVCNLNVKVIKKKSGLPSFNRADTMMITIIKIISTEPFWHLSRYLMVVLVCNTCYFFFTSFGFWTAVLDALLSDGRCYTKRCVTTML